MFSVQPLSHDELSLPGLREVFLRNGCSRVLAKRLAANDNTKNQVYFGPGFGSVNLIPNLGIYDASTPVNPIFRADLDFWWIRNDGQAIPAPHAKLILYPQYPEVRFSGFLLGCEAAPSSLYKARRDGRSALPRRLLILGLRNDRRILAYTALVDGPIGCALDRSDFSRVGVFEDVSETLLHAGTDTRSAMLDRLRDIHLEGWIDSIRLGSDGQTVPCEASNCGGYTLEAKLGISPNGFSEPDFLGWEVKQHGVKSFAGIGETTPASRITLMTPEPNGGVYGTEGAETFVRRYGYEDRKGRTDRMNFGGVHRFNTQHPATGLTLSLYGFDPVTGKFTDPHGSLQLLDGTGMVAASWSFAGLLSHWNRKHSQAVYVPSLRELIPGHRYSYGSVVRTGEGTDFLLFLTAISLGKVFYDPGLKLENISTRPRVKRRNQFRIELRDLDKLYHRFTVENLTG